LGGRPLRAANDPDGLLPAGLGVWPVAVPLTR
jgi:hypothetical protein